MSRNPSDTCSISVSARSSCPRASTGTRRPRTWMDSRPSLVSSPEPSGTPIREACNLSVLFLKYLLSAAGAAVSGGQYENSDDRVVRCGSGPGYRHLQYSSRSGRAIRKYRGLRNQLVRSRQRLRPEGRHEHPAGLPARPVPGTQRTGTRAAAIISATARPGSNSLPGLAVLRAASDRPSTTEAHRPPTSRSAPRVHGRTG